LTPREQKLYKKVVEELEVEIGKSKQVKAPDSSPTTELTGTSC
jgi:hypothetical protein